MQLKEIDWEHPSGATYIEVEYADETPIATFVNFLRQSKRWVQHPEEVEWELRKLNTALTEQRIVMAQGAPARPVRTAAQMQAAKERMARARAAKQKPEGAHATHAEG